MGFFFSSLNNLLEKNTTTVFGKSMRLLEWVPQHQGTKRYEPPGALDELPHQSPNGVTAGFRALIGSLINLLLLNSQGFCSSHKGATLAHSGSSWFCLALCHPLCVHSDSQCREAKSHLHSLRVPIWTSKLNDYRRAYQEKSIQIYLVQTSDGVVLTRKMKTRRSRATYLHTKIDKNQ